MATDSTGAPVATTTTGRGAVPNSPAPSPQPPATVANSQARIAEAADSPPGALAGVLLAPGLASAIELDVMVQTGLNPDAASLQRVAELLRQQSGKPVTVTAPRALPSAGSYSADDIRRIADQLGTRQGHDNTAVIHLMYLGGSYAKEGVLGIAVRSDTIAMFLDDIAGAATPLVSRTRIERSVVIHEVGHLLGLVDLFLDTQRGDPGHPGHSANRNSVMYWAVESDVVAQVLGGPPPVDFDAADLADLARIRSGATS